MKLIALFIVMMVPVYGYTQIDDFGEPLFALGEPIVDATYRPDRACPFKSQGYLSERIKQGVGNLAQNVDSVLKGCDLEGLGEGGDEILFQYTEYLTALESVVFDPFAEAGVLSGDEAVDDFELSGTQQYNCLTYKEEINKQFELAREYSIENEDGIKYTIFSSCIGVKSSLGACILGTYQDLMAASEIKCSAAAEALKTSTNERIPVDIAVKAQELLERVSLQVETARSSECINNSVALDVTSNLLDVSSFVGSVSSAFASPAGLLVGAGTSLISTLVNLIAKIPIEKIKELGTKHEQTKEFVNYACFYNDLESEYFKCPERLNSEKPVPKSTKHICFEQFYYNAEEETGFKAIIDTFENIDEFQDREFARKLSIQEHKKIPVPVFNPGSKEIMHTNMSPGEFMSHMQKEIRSLEDKDIEGSGLAPFDIALAAGDPSDEDQKASFLGAMSYAYEKSSGRKLPDAFIEGIKPGLESSNFDTAMKLYSIALEKKRGESDKKSVVEIFAEVEDNFKVNDDLMKKYDLLQSKKGGSLNSIDKTAYTFVRSLLKGKYTSQIADRFGDTQNFFGETENFKKFAKGIREKKPISKTLYDSVGAAFDQSFGELYRNCHLGYSMLNNIDYIGDNSISSNADYNKKCGRIINCSPATHASPKDKSEDEIMQFQCLRKQNFEKDLAKIKARFLKNPTAPVCKDKEDQSFSRNQLVYSGTIAD
ncbi:MAG: hypothetical protein HOE90_12250 [Bacteriovoracaceae bacterium]|jgi:hypothetical protein|nr:hypothetical protein [Bacteriovoracaceae bacterium]